MNRRRNWSYTARTRGCPRVRARETASGTYFIEWREGATLFREPVAPATREAARAHAREKALQLAGSLPKKAITLGRLLAGYHGAHAWAPSHRRNQEVYRNFWLDALGEARNVNTWAVTPALVNRIAFVAARDRRWSARTRQAHLIYIRAAIRWGHAIAGWLEFDPLAGMSCPRARSRKIFYSDAELDAISAVAPLVDPRFWAVWEIIRGTGRPLNSVLKLKWNCLDTMDLERAAVHFQVVSSDDERDSEPKYERAFLTYQAEHALLSLMYIPVVQENPAGVMFPGGRLERGVISQRPIGERSLNRMLRQAERRAGVETIRGRGFNGLRRSAADIYRDILREDKEAARRLMGYYFRKYRRKIDRAVVQAVEQVENRNGQTVVVDFHHRRRFSGDTRSGRIDRHGVRSWLAAIRSSMFGSGAPQGD